MHRRLRTIVSLALALYALVSLWILPAPALAQAIFKEGAPALAPEVKVSAVSFSPLVRELSPAVVNISVESDNDEQGEEGGAPERESPRSPGRSLGSGFIISEDGYIITNHHVIERSSAIIVRLLDDRHEYKAEVIGVDDKTDIALLKIKPLKKLKIAFFGDSDAINVGDWVIAIGNQFQLGQTVTSGIISATARRVPSGSPYDSYIQTDASINPGSSGGPLFNTQGQVIGINSAIFSPGRAQLGGSGFNIGIGFAIPINLAKGIVSQLKEHSKVTRGLLGVKIQKVDEEVADALGLEAPGGALVADVIAGTPASRAGFQRGDVIVSYRGSPVSEHEDLPLFVAGTPVDSEVPVEVIRRGKREVVTARIAELKDAPKRASVREKADRLGLVVSDLSKEIRREIEIPEDRGVFVERVEPGSIGERAGIVKGDVLEEIDREVIPGKDVYGRVVQALPGAKTVLVLLRNSDGTRYATIKLK